MGIEHNEHGVQWSWGLMDMRHNRYGAYLAQNSLGIGHNEHEAKWA